MDFPLKADIPLPLQLLNSLFCGLKEVRNIFTDTQKTTAVNTQEQTEDFLGYFYADFLCNSDKFLN